MKLSDIKVGERAKRGFWFEGRWIRIESEHHGLYYVDEHGERFNPLVPDITANDWVLIPSRQKKTLVIEDVCWSRWNEGIIAPYNNYFYWRELEGKPPMKMTLEWEE